MKWIASATLFAGVVLFIFPASARAETIVSSDIISDTTWTLAGSPYVVSGFLEIDSSVTLTIEPGVVVKFDTGAELSVSGDLRAEGTESQPIYFTSFLDDTVGGDTNGDSSGTVPAARDWVHIGFAPGAEGTFTHATIRYGGYVEKDPGDPPDPFTGIFNDGATVSLEYVTLSHNGEDGLVQTGNGTTTVFVSLIEEHESGIVVDSGFLTISYSRIINNDVGILAQRQFISPAPPAPVVSITDSEIAHNTHGILAFDVSLSIVNSIIHDNIVAGLHNSESGPLNAVGNWWGDPSGPTTLQNPGGTGDAILYGVFGTGSGSDSEDEVLFAPWLGEAPSLVPPSPPVPAECCSSVAFIPGIKATELYEGNSKRWLPGLFNFDGGRLVMNVSGESVNDITVGDPIRNAYIFLEIYEDFFDFLDNLKSTNVIADWESLPYDWRYDAYDVAAQDQRLTEDSLLNLADEIRDLAANSDTGKVTIIAHSNGGLVGKALVDELGTDAALIDRFVMVGTPQLGTPSAIGAMLHGEGQGLPVDSVSFAMSKATAREVSENMPGAYGLLPLAEYFNIVDTASDPPVIFDDFADTVAFRDAYGDTIDTPAEMQSFLLGIGDGRAKPASVDTLTPTILNSILLSDALTTRNALESWTAPSGIEVIQIVGWGLDTPKALRYYQRCEAFAGCFMDTKPEFTSDGDRTVVSPSADAFNDAGTYFLNLSAFNAANGTSWTHANILAASSAQDLLNDIILEEERSALFVTIDKPSASDASKRLRVSVHSPTTLGVRAQGRFTGVVPNPDPSSDIPVVVEEIPNSYYLELGNGKYVGFDVNGTHEIVLQGTGGGTFTLEIEEVDAGVVVNTAAYSDVPVSPTTVVKLGIQDIENKGELELDEDGDGEVDEIIAPDDTELSLNELLAQLKEKVQGLDIKDKLKKNLLKKIENLEKKIEKKKEKNAKILAKLENKITKQEEKGKLDSADADELLALLEELEAQAENVALDVEVLVALKEKIESLDIKKGLKNNLLKRVEKLENQRVLTKMLGNLSKKIMKKVEKGKIDDADAQELLDLLGQVESAL